MYGSKRKRISWFNEPIAEPPKQQDNITQTELPIKLDQEAVEPQYPQMHEIDIKQLNDPAERGRKVSMFGQVNNSLLQQSPPEKQLSVISEESASNQKMARNHRNLSLEFQTPKSNISDIRNFHLQTSKASLRESVRQVIDFSRELQTIGQSLENQTLALKKIQNKDNQDIETIYNLVAEKVVKMQKRLLELNQLEEQLLEKRREQRLHIQDQQLKPTIQEPDLIVGSSMFIRWEIVRILGFRIKELRYEKMQFHLYLQYQQCEILLILMNKKQIDKNLGFNELFQELRKELNENQLILQGIQIDCLENPLNIQKSEVINNALKEKYSNTQLLPNAMINSIVNFLPNFLKFFAQLERQLKDIQEIWGCLWKFDLNHSVVNVLFGYRHVLNLTEIQNGLVVNNRMVMRFMIRLKDQKIELYDSFLQAEVLQPFQSHQQPNNNLELTFGEKPNLELPSEVRKKVEQVLAVTNSILEVVELLNAQQFDNQFS